MSSTNFSFLISEFPEEHEAVVRLLKLLSEAAERQRVSHGAAPEWTVQRLFDIAHPSSQRVLARILTRLVEKGMLRQVVRVESETRGGIGDYDSVLEIPNTLFDQFLGRDIDVRMDQIRTIYSLRTA